MSYPFYCQYPASKRHTAFQHPCRSLFAAAALVAGPFTFPNPAFAALDCTTQPSCESLGYSQKDVENCSKYIKCPFDTTYKACTAIDCSSYTKTSCPEGAESCSKCSAGGHSFYKIDACKDGYTPKYYYILRPGTGSGTIVGGGSLVVDPDKWNGSSASVSTRSATTAASATATDVKDFTTSDTLVDWNDRVDAGDLVDWGDVVNPGGSQIVKPIGNAIIDCVKNTCQDGYVEDEDGECVKAYASCEAAGYLTSEPANAHCNSTHDIYLTNGTKVTCYSSSSCSCNDGYAEDENGQCVKDTCSTGFAKIPSDCGDSGSTGWQLGNVTDPTNPNCKVCLEKSCDGYSVQYKSVNDCTKNGHPEGWNYSSCFSGDTLMGKCTAKTCNTTCSVYKLDPQYMGDTLTQCRICGQCVRPSIGGGSILGECGSSTCKYAVWENTQPQEGYQGTCPVGTGWWVCKDTPPSPGIECKTLADCVARDGYYFNCDNLGY